MIGPQTFRVATYLTERGERRKAEGKEVLPSHVLAYTRMYLQGDQER